MERYKENKFWYELDMQRGEWYYSYYLKTEHWVIVRKNIFAFYPKKCMFCGEDKRLQVHHNNYDCLYQETVFDAIPMCGRCHKSIPFPDRGRALAKLEEKVKGNGINIAEINQNILANCRNFKEDQRRSNV